MACELEFKWNRDKEGVASIFIEELLQDVGGSLEYRGVEGDTYRVIIRTDCKTWKEKITSTVFPCPIPFYTSIKRDKN